MSYKVFLVDDHDLVRGGLKSLIEDDPTLQVVEQFGDGQALMDYLKHQSVMPDLIILDLEMPKMNGEEVLQEISRAGFELKVLVLSINNDEQTILDVVRLGARGFLPKYCSRHELRRAIKTIISTGYYHSEIEVEAMHHSIKSNESPRNQHSKSNTPYLTSRELEFIRLVCDRRELSYKLIAHEMKVAMRTVDGYREAVFSKLDIKTKTGLVFYALQHEIVQLDHI